MVAAVTAQATGTSYAADVSRHQIHLPCSATKEQEVIQADCCADEKIAGKRRNTSTAGK
jgi:hypothetical protein